MELEKIVESEQAVLVLFGGAHCNVCQVIRPKIEAMLAERFPMMRLFYVDCEAHRDLCAQQGVFSLPVARAYFAGQKVGEWVRTFSLGQLEQAISQPYALLFEKA